MPLMPGDDIVRHSPLRPGAGCANRMLPLFVYGTLKHGCRNHGRLSGAPMVGAATTLEPYVLMVGHAPYMFPGERHTQAVRGELYEASPALLQKLDWFEGHPNWYRRETIEVVLDQSGWVHSAYAYIFKHPPPPGSLLLPGIYREA